MRGAPLVLGLAAIAVTGCRGEKDGQPPAAANRSIIAADNVAVADDAPGNESEGKSILRPDVAPPEPEKPALEPVQGVVSFASAGRKLDDAGKAAIDALLATPAAVAGGPIVLRGNTDSRGNDRDNLAASRRRAEQVRDYMIEKGVAKDRIEVIALGETRPVAPNARPDGSDDPEGRARNRRVDVEIRLPPAGESSAEGAPEEAGNRQSPAPSPEE